MESLLKYPELLGQSILITGASLGIGAGLASAFAAQGCHIAVNYPDTATQPAADKIVNTITENGGKAINVRLMLAVLTVASMINTTLSEFGKLDILVNNAGIARSRLYKILLKTLGHGNGGTH